MTNRLVASARDDIAPGAGGQRPAPFFIVSSGRSGTTLLASMLNRTGEVTVPPESDFVARAFPFYWSRKSLNAEDYGRLCALFMKTSQMHGWKLGRNELMSALALRSPQTLREVNTVMCETFLGRAGQLHGYWGIKAPVLIASLKRILKLYPEARIVHIVRDGRDVCLSYRKVHSGGESFGPKGTATCALYWVDGLRRVGEIGGIAKLAEVRYEDLITNPNETMSSLCRFLEIRSLPDFANLDHMDSVMLVERHRDTIHRKLKEKPDPGNSGIYKREMSRGSVFAFELLSAPYLERYGYELEYPFLGAAAFNLVRGPLHALARAYNNVRYRRRDRRVYRSALAVGWTADGTGDPVD